MRKVSARWCSLLLGTSFIFGIPGAALAQTSLTSARVERLRNRVHLIPSGHNARLARVADVMNIGDALRTSSSARAELRFNDGSLARVGEQATFRFTPNTRNFQLSNGTVLLLIPPGQGRTTIQTPNAVTGIQGSALFVRVKCLAELTAEGYCNSPITFVGALTNNPAGAMLAYNQSGSQQQPIYAGEMVVIEGDTITQRLEFDLKTFYQTSGLVEGLQLDSSTPPAELSEDLQGVWQEIQDALKLQGDFDNDVPAEEIVENPGFIALSGINDTFNELDESSSSSVFASFPGFASSPAASFHGLGQPITTASSEGTSSVVNALAPETLAGGDANIDNTVTSASIRESQADLTPPAAPAPVAVTSSSSSATTSTVSSISSTNTNLPAISTVTPTGAEASIETSTPPSVVTTPNTVEQPITSVVNTPAPVEQPPTPVVTTPNPVEQPITSVVNTPAPVEQPPTPVVTTPNPVEQPITSVVNTPASIDKPETPVVNTPNPVDTPTVASTIPEEVVPTLEADQIPERPEVTIEDFERQQPAGANDPEVVLQSPDLSINGPNSDPASAPN
ncbi:FecR family protein [Leptothoe spongobia]|uniref:FecR domain-containing protein n=1 Tax=Leptothoe spongobia TAU-MAC 1115 TaxID=1967444 RepID=A0A947GJH6_9CYAN|nr:FecR family protein [Leptothoe spongobia]MBT9316569.1 FecR domain-containing protein [Leptothoe spongobia TAU-MAC 1115]